MVFSRPVLVLPPKETAARNCCTPQAGIGLETNNFLCYFCGPVSFVPAQPPAPATSRAPQGGHKAGGAPRPRPAAVWVWVTPSRCANSKQKWHLAQCLHAAGGQPGPAPAFWCPFSPPVSLQLVSHLWTMQTRPRAGCEGSWRAEPGWELAAQGPACLSLPSSDLLQGQRRASPQQPGQARVKNFTHNLLS